MAELSREAMVLMELSPNWQRRERYREASAAQTPIAQGLQIAVVAADGPSQALWARISSVLIRLGFARTLLEQSIVVQGVQADGLTHRLRQQRPEILLVLGDGLLQAARLADAALIDQLKVVAAPSLTDCLGSPQAKRALWVTLSTLHRQLSALTSPPQ